MDLPPFDLDGFLRMALAEDIGDGDHTSLATIPISAMGRARLLIKDEGVIAGMSIARRVFELVDASLQWEPLIEEGSNIRNGDVGFLLSGPARSITTGERLALNILQRMSGIATKTRVLTGLIEGTGCKLLDTRKTTPGFRHFEKLAVKTGGGVNHRYGLFDMILVKDNHIDYAGGVTPALEQVSEYLQRIGKKLQVEVEARNLQEVKEILRSKVAFRVLLDNFSIREMKEAVDYIGGQLETEASGGISEQTIRAYAETGVDYISVGALTHQIRSLDMSLKAVK
jgi:nicotinate-nucleotide pyrophosphorylase (carboxylating)